jgi:hypothetical protein
MSRNVICISDMPEDLHQWLKDEAQRRAESQGKRYAVALVVQEAVRDLKAKLEAIPTGNHHED